MSIDGKRGFVAGEAADAAEAIEPSAFLRLDQATKRRHGRVQGRAGELAARRFPSSFKERPNHGRPSSCCAPAVIANSSGGLREPGYLVADTLTELRAMLPGGLTRRDRTAVMLASVIETWD